MYVSASALSFLAKHDIKCVQIFRFYSEIPCILQNEIWFKYTGLISTFASENQQGLTFIHSAYFIIISTLITDQKKIFLLLTKRAKVMLQRDIIPYQLELTNVPSLTDARKFTLKRNGMILFRLTSWTSKAADSSICWCSSYMRNMKYLFNSITGSL